MSVLIWIQTVWHIVQKCSWKNFLKKLILKKVNRRQQKHEKLPSMKAYWKELKHTLKLFCGVNLFGVPDALNPANFEGVPVGFTDGCCGGAGEVPGSTFLM